MQTKRVVRRSSNFVPFILIPLIIIGGCFGGWFLLKKNKQASSPVSTGNSLPTPKIINSAELNKDLILLVSDESESPTVYGKLVTASKLNSVTVNGEPYSGNLENVYVSLELEYTNDGSVAFAPNSINLFRLVDDQERLFAPDFYNSQAVIPAESTIFDQVAFAVDKNQTHFKLRIGEVGSQDYEILEFDL